MYQDCEKLGNPLKRLLGGDRRRRSFLASQIGVAPERLGALLRSPQNLNCLEAFSFCRLYAIAPSCLWRSYQGLGIIEKQGHFDFDRFYPHEFSEKNFWRTLDFIASILKLREEDLAHRCGLTPAQFKHYSGRWRTFPFVSGMKLADSLKEDLVLFHTSDLELEALKTRLLMAGEVMAYLPKRYEHGAGSKMRLFENALDYLKINYGENFVRVILSSMGFPSEALRFKDKNISVLAFKDLHRKAIALSGDPRVPFELGRHNRVNHANKVLFNQLMDVRTHRQFYECVGKDIASKVDLNFNYHSIKVSQRSALIEARARPTRLTQLEENFLDRNVASYIYGHFLVGPGYFGLKECPEHPNGLEVDEEAGFFRFLCRY